VTVRLGFAGIALALLASCAVSAAGTPRVIEITIEHSAFDPDDVRVAQGSTVTFIVHNNDPIGHEFIIGTEEVQLVHELGTESHHPPRPGEMSVPAGSTRTTTFKFEEPSDLIFGCHLPGHYDYGMRGAIEVR